MKTKKVTYLLAALSVVLSGSAYAQTYAEVLYSATTITSNQSVGRIETKPDMVGVLAGYEMSSNLAVEGLFATGLSGSDTTLNGSSQRSPVETKVDRYFGVFVKPKMKLSETTELFVRVGRVEGKTASSTASSVTTDSGSNWAYGVGANYLLSSKTYLTGSFLQTATKSGVKSDTLSVGVGYRY
jgi:Outer membrane protein beta-barrel domain